MNIYTDLWQRAYLHFKIIKWGFLGYFDIFNANQAFSITLSSLPKNKQIKKVTVVKCSAVPRWWHDTAFSRLLPSVSCNVDDQGMFPLPVWDLNVGLACTKREAKHETRARGKTSASRFAFAPQNCLRAPNDASSVLSRLVQNKHLTHIDFFKSPIMRPFFLPDLQKLLFSNAL